MVGPDLLQLLWAARCGSGPWCNDSFQLTPAWPQLISVKASVNVFSKLKRTVRLRLLKTLPACREVVPLISESLDRRLSWWESIKLRLHLWVCNWCARYLTQIEMLSDFLGLGAEECELSSETLRLEARERIRRSLTNRP